MLSQNPAIKPSEITSETTYVQTRRTLLGTAGALSLGGLLPKSSLAQALHPSLVESSFTKLAALANPKFRSAATTTPWAEVASYVLYHEFGESADEAVKKSVGIKTEPWTIAVEGEVRNPKVYGVQDLLRLAPLEERIYRHRCVGGWYMVVPWVGYSLAELIKRVEPTANAKYVEFTSYWDPQIMGNAYYTFPYIESLRIDEAMHDLTLLCFGHHGRVLPKQNGAPLRIITPWKYAHKSPKAIVKIRFTEKQPQAFFYTHYNSLYGYYRNVHPDLVQGGSQKKEKLVGEWLRRRETPLLNGYADEVGHLYGTQLNSLR
jgi:methionine sulfoxide reductase catalytic subunit